MCVFYIHRGLPCLFLLTVYHWPTGQTWHSTDLFALAQMGQTLISTTHCCTPKIGSGVYMHSKNSITIFLNSSNTQGLRIPNLSRPNLSRIYLHLYKWGRFWFQLPIAAHFLNRFSGLVKNSITIFLNFQNMFRGQWVIIHHKSTCNNTQ
jgi:hypothetical protein